VPHIYAIGDVTNRLNLTPVAVREGHAFADTVFGNRPTPVDLTDVPTAVFSEPEVGVVGLTEAQACERLPKVDIYKTSFRPLKATLAGRAVRTFMKLVVDGTTGRVVGCHIVGPDAAEMVQLVGIAVKMKATKADFDAVMAVHPTAAEELVTMREKAVSHVRQAAE
jgi:glutathione reductase (NADPH)